jgi:hypothetical protein
MSNAMNNEIKTALTKYANSDLRAARKDGHILITQTKRGLCELTFDAQAKTYLLVVCITDPFQEKAEVVAQGKAGVIRAALVNLYKVEVDA